MSLMVSVDVKHHAYLLNNNNNNNNNSNNNNSNSSNNNNNRNNRNYTHEKESCLPSREQTLKAPMVKYLGLV